MAITLNRNETISKHDSEAITIIPIVNKHIKPPQFINIFQVNLFYFKIIKKP